MACPMQHNIHTGEKASGTIKADGGSKPAPGEYIKWDAEGVEVEQPGEQEKIKEVAAQFNRFQLMNFNEHMHCLRGTHLKTQGCVMGKFIVKDNLPEYLAQGMFAKPGSYDVIMRYSSLTPKLVPDNIPAPRGIGMKIFGVEGEKFWGEDKKTQDWTMNNYPVLELRDPKTTFDIADSLERNWNDLGTQLPRQEMVAMPQYSQAAYRHGEYVAKYGVFPLGEEQKKLEKGAIKEDDPINIISQRTRDFHMKHQVTYSFCAQMLQDLAEQPVDDIGIEWDPKKYPFEQIATLEFEPQDSWIPEFRVWWEDRITCNSWHGLTTHRPLGSTNRMRRVVYAESRKLRLRVNGYKDYVEPAGVKEVPASSEVPQFDLPHQHAVTSVAVAS
ncbi:hypothetical protein LTR08_004179 [Meristemomyces frigidus]|nr:hypothetical protein LTR08_004179 [Meristemomyces frigidus]